MPATREKISQINQINEIPREEQEKRRYLSDLLIGLYKRHLKEIEYPYRSRDELSQLREDLKKQISALSSLHKKHKTPESLQKDILDIQKRVETLPELKKFRFMGTDISPLIKQLTPEFAKEREFLEWKNKFPKAFEEIEQAEKNIKDTEKQLRESNPHIFPYERVAPLTPEQEQSHRMVKDIVNNDLYGRINNEVQNDVKKLSNKHVLTPELEKYFNQEKNFNPAETATYEAYYNSPQARAMMEELKRQSHEHFTHTILPHLGINTAARRGFSSVDKLEKDRAAIAHDERFMREQAKLLHNLHSQGLAAAGDERKTTADIMQRELAGRSENLKSELLKGQAAVNLAKMEHERQLANAQNVAQIGNQKQALEQQKTNANVHEHTRQSEDALRLARELALTSAQQPQPVPSTNTTYFPQINPAPNFATVAAGMGSNLIGLQPSQQPQQFAEGGQVPYSSEQQQMLQIMERLRNQEGMMNTGQNPHLEALPYLGAALLSKGNDEYATQALGRGYTNYLGAREKGETRKQNALKTQIAGLHYIDDVRQKQQKLIQEANFETKKFDAMQAYRKKYLDIMSSRINSRGEKEPKGPTATDIKYYQGLQDELADLEQTEKDLDSAEELLKGKVHPGGMIANLLSKNPLINAIGTAGLGGSQSNIETYNRLLASLRSRVTPKEGKKLSKAYADIRETVPDYATTKESANEWIQNLRPNTKKRIKEIQSELGSFGEGATIPEAIVESTMDYHKEKPEKSHPYADVIEKIENHTITPQEVAQMYSPEEWGEIKKELERRGG